MPGEEIAVSEIARHDLGQGGRSNQQFAIAADDAHGDDVGGLSLFTQQEVASLLLRHELQAGMPMAPDQAVQIQ